MSAKSLQNSQTSGKLAYHTDKCLYIFSLCFLVCLCMFFLNLDCIIEEFAMLLRANIRGVPACDFYH